MNFSFRRVRAIMVKELREYRRNNSIISGMAVIPLIFLIQPLVIVYKLPTQAAGGLSREHILLYLLAVPSLVPAMVGAYAVVGERQQGTLEPVLTTPIRRDEFLLGKALATLAPAVAIAYLVFGLFIALLELLVDRAVTAALLQWPQIVAQLIFTPLLAGWSLLLAIAISTRTSDVRVAQQLAVLSSLPTVVLSVLVAFDIIHPTLSLAIGVGGALLVLDGLGWRLLSVTLDRERLVSGTR
jgi:ABC-2 type transport system permease protein